MSRFRLVAGTLALTVLVLPVAGCGGSDTADKPKSSRSQASEEPAGATSSADVSAFVQKISDAMAAERTAKLEIELGSSMSATADVDYAEDGTSMALRMITGTQTMRVVLSGGVMYLQQTKGSKYLKIGKDDPALGSLLDQVSSIGPKSALEKVRPAIQEVRNVGRETIDGEELDHYDLTVDASKVTGLFGASMGGGETPKTPKTLTYGVWVDEDFLLRRVEMTLSGQKLVMKASDWGKPVTIAVPPASQVVTR